MQIETLGLTPAQLREIADEVERRWPDAILVKNPAGNITVRIVDGEHYADGTYWHMLSGEGWGSTPKCMLNNQPAPVGGCDGAVKEPSPDAPPA